MQQVVTRAGGPVAGLASGSPPRLIKRLITSPLTRHLTRSVTGSVMGLLAACVPACTASLILAAAMVAVMSGPAPAQQGSAATITAGQQVFQKHCAVCHSILPGATLVGPSLAGAMKIGTPAKATATTRAIIINGKGKMPGQKAQLSPQEINSLLAYLRTL